VQGFGPEPDAELRSAFAGTDQLAGDGIQVLFQASDRVVVQRAARQDQRLCADVCGKAEECVQMPLPAGPGAAVEYRVKVPDVTVHRTDPQSGSDNLGGHGNDGGIIQSIGNVVAHSRKRAQVDLFKAQFTNGVQGGAEFLVPEADG
jgi:hypothetical protein